MDEDVVRRGIPRLDATQKEIIYLRCTRGLTTGQLITELNTNSNTLNYNLRRIYDILWLNGIEDITPAFCRIFQEVAGEPPYTGPSIGVQATEEEIEEETQAPPPPPTRESPRPIWQRIATVILVFAVILGGWKAIQVLGFGCPLWSVDPFCPFNRQVVAEGPEVPPTEIAQQTDPTEEVQELEPANIPETAATEVIEVEPTREPPATDVPTSTPEPTDTPTITPTPSQTPTPTETPIPTPTREWPTIIEEDFSEPLNTDDQLWEIEGNPAYVNGGMVIRPGDTVWLQIGDNTWRNYTIRFDILSINCRSGTNLLGVRVQDRSNMTVYEFNLCEGRWYNLINGEVQAEPGSGFGHVSNSVEIIVEDRQVRLLVSDNLVTTINNIPYEIGGVVFKLIQGAYDDLRIERTD